MDYVKFELFGDIGGLSSSIQRKDMPKRESRI